MNALADRLLAALGFIRIADVVRDAQLERDLAMLTVTNEDRRLILECGVIAAKAGATPGELEELIGKGRGSALLVLRELSRWQHLDPGIAKRMDEIWEEQ